MSVASNCTVAPSEELNSWLIHALQISVNWRTPVCRYVALARLTATARILSITLGPLVLASTDGIFVIIRNYPSNNPANNASYDDDASIANIWQTFFLNLFVLACKVKLKFIRMASRLVSDYRGRAKASRVKFILFLFLFGCSLTLLSAFLHRNGKVAKWFDPFLLCWKLV